MLRALDGHALLALWEGALAQPESRRGDAVLQLACAEEAPACTLGQRNLRLAALHAHLFGRGLDLLSHCPGCGTVAQFSGDCAALLDDAGAAPDEAPHRIEADGFTLAFRLPAGADVQAAAEMGGGEVFARHLLERCVLDCTRQGEPCEPHDLPLAVLDRLSQRMEALDPAARVSFALACPHCASRWDAQLDLGGLLWQKLQAAAERLLLDVDTLARHYGWSEAEVIAMSPTRRAAYVQMAAP